VGPKAGLDAVEKNNLRHCDMTPERRNSGTRETAVARERLDKHIVTATAVTSRNNRRAAGSGVATGSVARRTVQL
jgi:hypothetical protein